jgi:lipopolysaccharide/colanic/teichoic acid biosynthesis glycosyltransferase
MSIVGPRPEDPRYLAAFSEELVAVLSYPPGITSPASIRYRDEESVLAAAADPHAHYVDEVLPAKARIDLDYLRGRTVRSDIGVVLATIRAVVRR